MSRLRVLLIAADSDPRSATGPLHAWNLAHRIAEHCDVELVTHGRCRAAIHELGAFAAGRVRFVDGARGWWFGHTALGIARDHADRGLVDVIHLLDPLGTRTIRGLARLDAALVVGPTLAPLPAATRFADVALVTAQTSPRRSERPADGQPIAIDPVAADTDLLEPAWPRRGATLRVAVPCRRDAARSIESLLRSFAGVDDIALDPLGDLPPASLRRTLQAADLLLDPSPTGGCAELSLTAMALGVPIVAVRGSSTAAYTTSLTGLQLERTDGPELHQAMHEALRHFRDDEPMRRQAGRAARCHVERCHSWNRRVADVLDLYRTAITDRTAPRLPILLTAPAGLYGGA